MASCQSWIYDNVDENVFRKLQSTASKQGIAIPNQPSGEFRLRVSAFQIVFRYKLDARGRKLHLVCVDKPVMLSCNIVKSYADNIVRSCGGIPS
jgi:hypothetical protein